MTREKEFKKVAEQIIIQKARKLKIHNEKLMSEFILRKNYFNSINGFESLFLYASNPKVYSSRVSFKDIERMYNLDREIAKFLFHEIEKVEIELKTRIAYEFAKVYCSSGITSNLNYLDINNYTLPSTHSSNSFTEYFYDVNNHKKTHPFFKKHFIKAKLSNINFNGTIDTQTSRGVTYYRLSGTFNGTIDDLKNNIYSGVFSIKDANTPSYITSQVNAGTVSITLSGLRGNFSDLSYSDYCKIKFPHISSYRYPPLWVIIDTLMLKQLLVLFQGLGTSIQNKIISDMGFDSSLSGSREKFINACEILHELRNQMAHFGLITRYRTSNKITINSLFITELSLTPKTSNKILKFYQSLKILNCFQNFSIKEIDRLISIYSLKNIFLFKAKINKKFFNRIGK
ncbi:Abi family protein [Streptococcus suis]